MKKLAMRCATFAVAFALVLGMAEAVPISADPPPIGSVMLIADGIFTDNGNHLMWTLVGGDGPTTLNITGSDINMSPSAYSPWIAWSDYIERIVISGSIIAGASLEGLFSGLGRVTSIDGLHNIDTSGVLNMARVFSGLGATSGSLTYIPLDLSGWNTSNVTDMSGMFANANVSAELNWDVRNVQSMASMFQGSGKRGLFLQYFEIDSLTDVSFMFQDAIHLEILNLENWDMSGTMQTTNMFLRATTLQQLTVGAGFRFVGNPGLPPVPTFQATGYWQNVGAGTVDNPLGTYVFTSDELVDFYSTPGFADTWVWQRQSIPPNVPMPMPPAPATCGCPLGICTITQQGILTNQGSNLPWRFYSCGTLVADSGTKNNTGIDFGQWQVFRDQIHRVVFTGPVIGVGSLRGTFHQMLNVTEIVGLEHFDTSAVTDMGSMFMGASSITNLNLSSWNTENVQFMTSMFDGTTSLNSLNIAGWDTRNVTDMSGMLRITATGQPSVRRLTMGGINFRFSDIHSTIPPIPPVPTNAAYTGHWINVYMGTAENPQGWASTSTELMESFNIPSHFVDTWVWQRVDSLTEETCNICGHYPCECPGIDITNRFVCPNFYAAVREMWQVPDTGPILDTHVSWMTTLFLEDRNISNLSGIEYFTSLLTLNVSRNYLTSLDVSGLTSLTWMSARYNQLASLDVSGLSLLNTLDVLDNQLTSINLNGLTSLTWLNVVGNQLTSLDVSGLTALTTLLAAHNQLTSLDVSELNSLTLLGASNNQLTSLDVSGLTALTSLSAGENQLTSLDVNNLTALTSLHVWNNQLTNIDVNNLTALTSLYVGGNQFTSLDVNNLTALTSLNVVGNQLTSLDVSGLSSLSRLNVAINHLTSLDVSGLSSLTSLGASSNQLTSLDVRGLPSLAWLWVDYNYMTSPDAVIGWRELFNEAGNTFECNFWFFPQRATGGTPPLPPQNGGGGGGQDITPAPQPAPAPAPPAPAPEPEPAPAPAPDSPAVPPIISVETAVEYVQDFIAQATPQAREDGHLEVFAEQAIMSAASTYVDDDLIVVNFAEVEGLQEIALKTQAELMDLFSQHGYDPARDLRANVAFVTSQTDTINIRVEPTAMLIDICYIWIRTPYYDIALSNEFIENNAGTDLYINVSTDITVIPPGFAASVSAPVYDPIVVYEPYIPAPQPIFVLPAPREIFNEPPPHDPSWVFPPGSRLPDFSTGASFVGILSVLVQRDDSIPADMPSGAQRSYTVNFNRPVNEPIRLSVPTSPGSYQTMRNTATGENVGGRFNP
ncbi:MAG: BspA family leucine-rich repeat surface protein, partial [Defluviitaleaceae bacterium]|nr:BspA family leucine-rich repeat surface protein [Defluviitaleaceae bacterium]